MTATTDAPLNPNALSRAAVAQLLSATGGEPITEAFLAAHQAAGAPTNPDGTWNLLHYAAWLIQQRAARADGE